MIDKIPVLDDIIIGRVEPQIYAFSTQTIPNYLKVGDTYRPIEVRLDEWRKYFPNLKKCFNDLARVDKEVFFRDLAVHGFLENTKERQRLKPNTFSQLSHYSKEFFKDATGQDIKEAIEDIKNNYRQGTNKYQFYKFANSRIPITYTYSRTENYLPRPNQQQTINKFKEAVVKGRTNLLMYAVMRFGKSFTSMCCATEINAKLVVIVSAKADVKEEWKKTVESHKRFVEYDFIDSQGLQAGDAIISTKLDSKRKVVVFLTLQDLQGKKIKNKHKEVFDKEIDLLIIDETHFGARASEYGKVLHGLIINELRNEMVPEDTLEDLKLAIKVLKAHIQLHLSGTPYRILMGSEFSKEDIIAFYQFSDIVRDKEQWDKEHLCCDNMNEWDNPYYGFPQMIRFAFEPNESSRQKMEQMKENGTTYALSALFKPQSIVKDIHGQRHKKFENEQEVMDLLEAIDGSKSDDNLLGFLDYRKIQEGKMCRHIVCVLPYRASCDAMEALLESNRSKFKNFKEYEIINIAGVDNVTLYEKISSVKDKISSCQERNQKTITLTVNRMLTGSTVPEWDTMLYLKDTESPQEYDQAIFRLQNQYIREYTDQKSVIRYNMKPQTLLVDFDPNRMFRMQEEKAQIYNANVDKKGNTKLEERIKYELEISPIIVLNKSKIVRATPADILDSVRKYSSEKSVLDEATTIPIDVLLLNDPYIRATIDNQGEIASKQGLSISPVKGKGDDLDIPPQENHKPLPAMGDDITENKPKEDEIDELKGKFAMYYAKILFCAFLIGHKVKSLQDIITQIDNNDNDKRIAENLGVDREFLFLLQKQINSFILSKLDYKIQNISTLANDKSILPAERVRIAMKKFSRLSDSEVVTPENVAGDMVNLLPSDKMAGLKILDIASKQGEFVYAIYKNFGKSIAQNCYSIPTSKIAYEFTRKVYELLELDISHIELNSTSYDFIESKVENCKINFRDKYMKFDVLLGNPPYQEGISKNQGNKSLSKQLFPSFIEKSLSLKPKYCSLITPTRWFTADGQDNSFPKLRKFIKENYHNRISKFVIRKGQNVFPMVTIPGTVGYFLYDSTYNGAVEFDETEEGKTAIKCSRPLFEENLDIILDSHIKADILHKVIAKADGKYLTKITTGRDAFGISGNKEKFEAMSEDQKFPDCAQLKTVKGIRYIRKDSVFKNREIFEKYKIFISKADGAAGLIGDRDKNGDLKQSRILGRNVVAMPFEACTDTYIPIGCFDNQIEAENLSKYLQTRFVRFMVGIMKISQNIYQNVYQFVPLQDFSTKSDICWLGSISEIDNFLFCKYDLTKNETDYIKKVIAPM